MHQWHQGNFLYVQTYLANKRILILILKKRANPSYGIDVKQEPGWPSCHWGHISWHLVHCHTRHSLSTFDYCLVKGLTLQMWGGQCVIYNDRAVPVNTYFWLLIWLPCKSRVWTFIIHSLICHLQFHWHNLKFMSTQGRSSFAPLSLIRGFHHSCIRALFCLLPKRFFMWAPVKPAETVSNQNLKEIINKLFDLTTPRLFTELHQVIWLWNRFRSPAQILAPLVQLTSQ